MIWFGVIVAAILAGIAFDRRRRSAVAAKRVAAWGSARPLRGEGDQIARYHRLLVESDPSVAAASVGDQEWHDLALNDVFAELDRTCGAIGQQALYHRLRVPACSNEQFMALGRFDAAAHRFSDDVSARERVQALLTRLEDSAAYALPRLFLMPLPRKPPLAWLFPVLLVAPIGALVAALAGIAHGWEILLLLLFINFAVRNIVAADVAWIAEPFRVLYVLLDVAGRLRRDGMLEDDRIDRAFVRLSRLKRATSFIATIENGGDVLRAFVDYFNMLFLVDLNVFSIAHGECARRRDDVRVVFEAVGDLDAALSIASYRAGRSLWCRPVILPDGSGIDAMELVHPLLSNAHANNVRVEPGRGVVITGSNMSGKTTLLRALGVNTLLAQTIHTCTARRFACPPMVVRSAIALADDILDGKSYYLVEASTILSMVHAAGNGQHLFLLDELFRGTNTVERIAAGVAVMEALVARRDVALVATHDNEIVQLVCDLYDANHFSESVTSDGFAFDYVLRPGPATGRNAISLLRSLGAPEQLANRAAELSGLMESEAVRHTEYHPTS